jgi:hypothetical protein
MKSVELYGNNRQYVIFKKGYNRNDINKYISKIRNKKIPNGSKKVYFLDNKFPKRLFNKSKFIYCNDINDAEIIAIPKTYFYEYNWYPAKSITDNLYVTTWDTTGCVIANYPIYDHKYIEILDDPRVILYNTLYKECRKNLQTLTEDERLSIKELMNSLDKDVQLMGAMMIAKSNLEINDELCSKAIRIICESDINLTKELKAFINDY